MSLQPPIYRQAALEKYKSPQSLDEIPQLTPLHAWVALAALACLIGAALLWGMFGTLISQIETQGVVQSGTLVVTLDAAQAAQIQTGMIVRALCSGASHAGTVRAIIYNTQQRLFEVTVMLDSSPPSNTPCSVSVITREEHPLQRVFPAH